MSRLRRQKKNARIASKAITAIGTTTAIAMVPPFDNPLLELAGSEVALEDDEVVVIVAELVKISVGGEVVVG